MEELESGKRWLEEQRSNWQAQATHWQAQATHWQAQAEHCQERVWGRLGLRLGLLQPAQDFSLPPPSHPPNNAAKNDLE
jgi:hypothetical protein